MLFPRSSLLAYHDEIIWRQDGGQGLEHGLSLRQGIDGTRYTPDPERIVLSIELMASEACSHGRSVLTDARSWPPVGRRVADQRREPRIARRFELIRRAMGVPAHARGPAGVRIRGSKAVDEALNIGDVDAGRIGHA